MKCKPQTVHVLVLRDWKGKYVKGEETCAQVADVRNRRTWFQVKGDIEMSNGKPCCGGGMSLPGGIHVSYMDNPSLFQLCVIQKFATTPTSFVGKSGRQYSTRKDGDQVYALKVDVPGDDRLEPIDDPN